MYCDCEKPRVGGYPRLVKARKPHKCCECHQKILSGQEYCRIDGIWEEPASFCLCVSCQELGEKLRQDGGCFGYGELEDYIFESELVDTGDDEIAQGRNCAIATTVPWLARSHGRFHLVKAGGDV